MDRKQAGAFAGVSINLLVFPLDTLKTRLQSLPFQQTYTTTSGIMNRALWRGLYQGVGTVMLVTIPSSGVFFTTYEGLKYLLGGGASPTVGGGFLPHPVVHALSSSIAQLVNCAVVTPAEVLKQNAQMARTHGATPGSPRRETNKISSSSTIAVLRQLKRRPTQLWRGYTALAARDLPFTALQFPAFEYLRGALMARRSRLMNGGEPIEGIFERTWISALSAGIAGSAAAWLTTPFDVVKTRMMLEAGSGADDSLNAKCGSEKSLADTRDQRGWRGRRRSVFQIGKEVFLSEGTSGLFRGASIRALLTVLGNGLYMGCYEGAKLYLQRYEKAAEGGSV